MSVVEAVVGQLVRLSAWLPTALRPGSVGAVLLAASWLAIGRHGYLATWHGTWRAVAVGVDRVVGVAVLPQHLLVTRRRRRGAGSAIRATTRSGILARAAERALDAATEMHRRHDRGSVLKPFPLRSCALLVMLPVLGAFVAAAVPGSPIGELVSGWFDDWEAVERWAERTG
jgi:hypothetical protein